MYVPVILGTARKGRESARVAAFILAEAKRNGLESEILDVRDFPMTATDNTPGSDAVMALAAKIQKADALVIVTPEYNHGYPGELKLMLDSLYDEYRDKPLGLCGVSSGPIGGARAIEQLRLVAVELRMRNIGEAMYFPGVKSLFEEDGAIREPEDWERRAGRFFKDLVSHANKG